MIHGFDIHVLFSVAVAGSIAALAMSQAPSTGPVDEAALRVITFNVRCSSAPDGANAWPHRREQLIARLRWHDADVIGLQEVLADQADAIRSDLDAYTFIGVGRDDGRRAGEFSPILFRTARFEKLDSGTIWLSRHPDQPGSKDWDAAITRIATWARLHDRRQGGRELLVMNTHYDHVGTTARLESSRLIVSKIRALAGERTDVVLLGDFNCHDTDAPIRVITDDGKLIDGYRQVHPTAAADEATYHGFKGTAQGRRIDFIFHSPGLRTVEATIDRDHSAGRYPSDHFAVTAALARADRDR
jgi:endonuclease/exonuclease/phosphatase family metal-dependent hydrolase